MEFGGVPPILVFPYPEDIRKTNLLMVEEAQNPFRTVVQLVRILACHASGRGFDSRQSCHIWRIDREAESAPLLREWWRKLPVRSNRTFSAK